MFNRKGQGSLEYLLLIGGAVLVAAIVIALVLSSGTSGGDDAKLKTASAQCYARVSAAASPTVSVQGTTYYCCTTVSPGVVGTTKYAGATATNPSGSGLNVASCAIYASLPN